MVSQQVRHVEAWSICEKLKVAFVRGVEGMHVQGLLGGLMGR